MFGKEETRHMQTPVMPESSLDSPEHAAEDEESVRGRGARMEYQGLSRRTLLKGGSAALAGLTVLRVAGPAPTFPGHSGEEVIPWLDQPPPGPFSPENVGNLLVWEGLD